MVTLLLSIHPRYAEMIMSGRKKVELRKKRIRDGVENLIIYSTAPICKIVGSIEIVKVEVSSPQEIFSEYKDLIGIEKTEYFRYYEGHKSAIAILLGEPRPIKPRPLNDVVPRARPPQSYIYVSDEILNRIHSEPFFTT